MAWHDNAETTNAIMLASLGVQALVPVATAWQPAATAPKDRPVLARRTTSKHENGCAVVRWRFDCDQWQCTAFGIDCYDGQESPLVVPEMYHDESGDYAFDEWCDIPS